VEIHLRLIASIEEGEKGAVISVMAAGTGGTIDLRDLALKKGFSVRKVSLCTLTDIKPSTLDYGEKIPVQ